MRRGMSTREFWRWWAYKRLQFNRWHKATKGGKNGGPFVWA